MKTCTENSALEKAEIDALVGAFFSAFDNRAGKLPSCQSLYRLFIVDGRVIKNAADLQEIYTLEQFIEPRQKLLTSGELVDFSEQELNEHTDIFGRIAHRFCAYQKSGIHHGTRFSARGMKSMQFIKTTEGWRISSVAWDDERSGLSISDQ